MPVVRNSVVPAHGCAEERNDSPAWAEAKLVRLIPLPRTVTVDAQFVFGRERS